MDPQQQPQQQQPQQGQPQAQPGGQPQAPKKMSQAEFANKVRPLLGPAGGGISDADLTKKILERRPDLADQVDMTQPAAQPPAQQQQGQGGMKPIGFGQGFKQGLNPFHTPPEGIKKKVGGVATFAEDMVNAREISQRGGSGDKAGAIGMAAGTAVQQGFMGVGLEAAGEGMRALGSVAEHSAMTGPAMKYAKRLSREIGGSIKDNQIAARYIQPIRAALDKKWNALHSALDGQMFSIQQQGLQMIKKLKQSEIPGVKKLAEELAFKVKSQAMDYKEAEYYRRQMSKMVSSGKAEHWASDLEKFVDYLEGEVQQLAQKHGVGDLRSGLKSDTKQAENIAKSVAGTVKQPASAMKKVGGAVAGGIASSPMGGGGVGLGALLGERAAASPSQKLLPQFEKEAEELAAKHGVKLEKHMFKGETSALHKAGTATKVAGKVGPKAVRAAASAGHQATSSE